MVDTPIVSESLQKVFRDNFPSQINSGRDLHVSDVILPIVDFSSTAGVSGLGTSLQEAIAFGNQTSFNVNSGTNTTIINNTGFFRVFGVANMIQGNNTDKISFVITDGSTNKTIWSLEALVGLSGNFLRYLQFDFNVFLTSGDSLVVSRVGGTNSCVGSTRQLADISGTLVNPTGYTGS